ncbi:MAG: PD-(D/E)XK nuclease family protein [Bacteroidales bacterium]|nr:PD-(D/E)XK nuclease family protein [Bacteroidales bacterium]
MSFLSSVAEYYVRKYPDSDWNRLHFVFPSHRSGVFFKNALQSCLGDRVIVGLRIMTIDDFFNSHSELKTADDLTLTFELFRIYKRVFDGVVADVNDFTFFYSWATSFLNDFDDVDKYMVDAHQIFTNVSDYNDLSDDFAHLSAEQREAIESFWEITLPKPDETNEFKHNFVSTYRKLEELYTEFSNSLKSKGLAYKGMIVREVTDKFRSLSVDTGDVHYVFVGFNALTEAEKTVFGILSKAHKADFFWDYSPLMLTQNASSDDHGPGRFIRSCLKAFPMPDDYQPSEVQDFTNKNITVTHFAYRQGQIAKIASLFGRPDDRPNGAFASSDAESERTAIVLTDESMLLPVVAAIPESIKHINVTMGYPLKQSPAFGFIDLLARLQKSENYSSTADDVSFYHKVVLPVLQHPIVASICQSAYNMIEYITRNNLIRVGRRQLAADELLSLIFRPITDNDFVGYLNPILELVYNKYVTSEASNDFQRECVYHCVKVLNRFGDILDSLPDDIAADVKSDKDLIFNIFVDILENQSVDFKGMPLRGLQVMGILETRALDFDNILILDMNEGIFPKTSTASTLIPYVIRKTFGLPTHEFQDSMYAYYFYRLIHRAKNIEMVYSDSDNMGVSRFVLQLKHEHKVKLNEFVGVHKLLNTNVYAPSEIAKNEQIMQRMKALFCEQKYISPTKIIHYIKCPVYFYYNDVLRLADDEDEVFEEIDKRRLGTIFHYLMQHLYSPGKEYTEAEIKKIRDDKELLNSLILKSFANELFNDENHPLQFSDLEARNILYFYAVCKYLDGVLAAERPFHFIEAEQEVKIKRTLADGLEINIGGVIDRQDKCDGMHRVIDYKTGSDKDFSFADVEELFDETKIDDKKAIFQTLMYCYLINTADNKTNASEMVPVVYKVVSDKSIINEIKIGEKKKTEIIVYSAVKEQFEQRLFDVLDVIFNSLIPFRPSASQKRCIDSKCQFYDLCYRSRMTEED